MFSPAPGYRNANSGLPTCVGYDGFSWSASTDGTGGMDLIFRSPYLYPAYSDLRGHGIQLRCLSE